MTSNSYSQSSNYKIFLPFLGDEWIYAQNIALPGFSLNPSQINFGGKSLYIGGDHIDYDPVTVGFLVGEDFKIYTKLTFKVPNQIFLTYRLLTFVLEKI